MVVPWLQPATTAYAGLKVLFFSGSKIKNFDELTIHVNPGWIVYKKYAIDSPEITTTKNLINKGTTKLI